MRVVMTLCPQCLDVFLSDKNYIVRPAKATYEEKHDNECFICCRKGRDYEIIKKLKSQTAH